MIAAEIINRTAKKISAMNEPKCRTLAHIIKIEQPFVLARLFAINEREGFDDTEADIFFNAGTVYRQSMKQYTNGSCTVIENALEKAEKENESLLKKKAR